MVRRWTLKGWELLRETFVQWQRHRSAEMASALAYYGVLAAAGVTLIGVYAAARIAGTPAWLTTQTARDAGAGNEQVVRYLLEQALTRHDAWVALLAGAIAFVLALVGIAFQIQRILDAVWAEEVRKSGNEVRHNLASFAAIFLLATIYMAVLLGGAALHGMTSHTHHLPLLTGTLYQGLDAAVGVVVLAFIFLFIFAYVAPVDVPWRHVWIASVVAAVLCERGEFALSIYFGQMDARSPYADAGAVLAVVLWLYYSAEVVVLGAEFTRVLRNTLSQQRGHATGQHRQHRADPAQT